VTTISKARVELMEKVIMYVHQFFKDAVFAKAYEEDVPAAKRLKNLAKASLKRCSMM
jgi:hypothetical protein